MANGTTPPGTVTIATPAAAQTTPTVAPDVPKPISDSLQREIDRVRTGIPTGKRGWATVGVSNTGVQVGVGANVTPWLSAGGYAARMWGGGWVAGAQAQVVW